MDQIYEKYATAPNQGGWFSGWFSRSKPKNPVGKFDLENGNDGEGKSLINKAKTGFFTKANNVKEQVTSAIDTGSNLYAAATFFFIGCLFLLLAFTFLPIVLISPAKFNLFFSLGSLFIQVSLAFYHGPLAYLKILFTKENLVISLLYIVSMVLAIYSSLFWGSYISALLIIALQVFSLLYFLMATFTGGKNAQTKLQSLIFGSVMSRVLVMMKLKSQEKNLFEF